MNILTDTEYDAIQRALDQKQKNYNFEAVGELSDCCGCASGSGRLASTDADSCSAVAQKRRERPMAGAYVYNAKFPGRCNHEENTWNGRETVMNQLCYGERESVYRNALKVYGQQLQEVVAIEELSEVVKEVCKMQRGQGSVGKLAEEIADATIMLEQLRMIYGINEEVCAFMDQKILRLKKNVENEAAKGDIWICRSVENGR